MLALAHLRCNNSPMSAEREHVDPAALLMGVLAVGIGPLTTEGAWDPVNTAEAAVVLAVVWAYTFSRGMPTFVPAMAADALVVGFIAGIGLAWPAQEIFGWSQHTNWADYVSLGIGLIIAVIVFDWMLRENGNRRLGIVDLAATLRSRFSLRSGRAPASDEESAKV